MRTLREKRCVFTWNISLLILKANTMGYEVGGAFLKRCDNCLVGKKKSKHKQSLAMDLDLYSDGTWLDKTEDHKPLGEMWEKMGGVWGGRFSSPDGNHYEYGKGLK